MGSLSPEEGRPRASYGAGPRKQSANRGLQTRPPAPRITRRHSTLLRTPVAGHLMNLIFGIVWLIAGVAILVWQAVTNTPLLYINVGFPFSSGYLALMLAAYN